MTSGSWVALDTAIVANKHDSVLWRWDVASLAEKISWKLWRNSFIKIVKFMFRQRENILFLGSHGFRDEFFLRVMWHFVKRVEWMSWCNNGRMHFCIFLIIEKRGEKERRTIKTHLVKNILDQRFFYSIPLHENIICELKMGWWLKESVKWEILSNFTPYIKSLTFIKWQVPRIFAVSWFLMVLNVNTLHFLFSLMFKDFFLKSFFVNW